MDDPARIRNFALIGHAGAGKTSLGEALLFFAGATKRLGRVADGSSVLDFYPEEIERKGTFTLSVVTFSWKGYSFNLVDPPGSMDFAGDVASALRAADCAVLVVNAGSGVEVGAEKYWDLANQQNLPRVIFINQMKSEKAKDVLNEVRTAFGALAVPLQVHQGLGPSFAGVFHILAPNVPADLQEEAAARKEQLIEALAEVSDALAEKYLDGKPISEEELAATLKQGILQGKIAPVLYGDALQSIGVEPLLELLVKSFPSPLDIPPQACVKPEGRTVKAEAKGPFAAIVFKTVSEPHVGEISYVRVFSGELKAGSDVQNTAGEHAEKVNQIYMLFGKERKEINAVGTGSMCALVKLKNTRTGDTLTSKDLNVQLKGIDFPKPSIYEAIMPKSKADEERFSEALSKLRIEDPSFSFHFDPEIRQHIIYGLGDQHLAVIQTKMKKKFNVEIETQRPRVAYRESIRRKSEATGRFVRQSGGRGQYGVCVVRLEPQPRGTEFEFVNDIFGGSIPGSFIPAVEAGVRKALGKGVYAGCPVVDIKLFLLDGKYHEVDSSQIAFEIAGSMGFKAAEETADPYLLEPIYTVEVTAPDEDMGAVIGDLNGRRARILGMDAKGKMTAVKAIVPLAEMYRYSNVLKSLTGGRGYFSMEFNKYEEVPREIAAKLVPELRKERGVTTEEA